MNALALVFYALCAFGLAYILGHARISLAARSWLAADPLKVWTFFVELVECPACFGFWEGVAFGALAPQPWLDSLVPFVMPRWGAALALGLFTCAVGFLLGRATGWLRED